MKRARLLLSLILLLGAVGASACSSPTSASCDVEVDPGSNTC